MKIPHWLMDSVFILLYLYNLLWERTIWGYILRNMSSHRFLTGLFDFIVNIHAFIVQHCQVVN